jgi:hypothetical protein
LISLLTILFGLDAAQHPIDGRNAGQRLLRADFLLPKAVSNFPGKNGWMNLLVELQREGMIPQPIRGLLDTKNITISKRFV